MNFTREPIIETIISPKEGYKLTIRSSKISSFEEMSVEALEIVSFGSALFYRSLEKPRCFLLPVSDYEVVEAKETRVVLKNASFEKNIKIGGGKEAPKPYKEEEPEAATSEASSESAATSAQSAENGRKRDRRRNRRKRPHEERADRVEGASSSENAEEAAPAREAPKAPLIPVFAGLIPPPTTLISEKLARYKEMQKEVAPEGSSFSEESRKVLQPVASEEVKAGDIS